MIFDSVVVVGKGPSAVNVNDFRGERDHIAAINDAGKLVDGFIDYCFFTHTSVLRNIEDVRQRISTFVSPSLEKFAPKESVPGWFSEYKHIEYDWRTCAGDIDTLSSRIVSGGICHHNTTNGAIHWLAKHGRYRKIKIIGVDGGKAYAPGMAFLSDKVHQRIVKNEGTDEYLDIWRQVTKRLCRILQAVYGVEFEWYEQVDQMDHSSEVE